MKTLSRLYQSLISYMCRQTMTCIRCFLCCYPVQIPGKIVSADLSLHINKSSTFQFRIAHYDLCIVKHDIHYHSNTINGFCLGDNDRASRVLFVQHPRAQDEQRQADGSLFPLWHETWNFGIFSRKFVPRCSDWTAAAAILFLEV